MKSTERRDRRIAVLQRFGATPSDIEELLRYNDNAFVVPPPGELVLPLPDEPFVAVWEEYAADAAIRGVVPVLQDIMPQLSFPIQEGIGETEAYIAATRRGVRPERTEPMLAFEGPEHVHLTLHGTPAGRIPVLLFEKRDDYESVIRAIYWRNEPVYIHPGQGASMVAGYNNWDRIARIRASFERGELGPEFGSTWPEAFAKIRDQRERYQDRFILLSVGPYSGVRGAELGLTGAEWRSLSNSIRLGHECAHYLTKRAFGAMGRSLLDELIADYVGLVVTLGSFNAVWALRFLGLEHPTVFLPGGRLEIYRGTPALSDSAFEVLQRMVRRAIRALDIADMHAADAFVGADRWLWLVLAMASLTVEEIVDDDGVQRIGEVASAYHASRFTTANAAAERSDTTARRPASVAIETQQFATRLASDQTGLPTPTGTTR